MSAIAKACQDELQLIKLDQKRRRCGVIAMLCSIPMLFSFALYSKSQPLHFYTEHNPPGEYLNEHGQVSGATVALVKLLQQRLAEPGDIELLPWARAYEYALKQPNTVLFSTARNPGREALFQWVGPVKIFDMKLYTTMPDNIRSLADLPGNYIACGYRGASYVEHLLRLGFVEGKNLVLVLQAGDCSDMLKRGRAQITALNAQRHGEQTLDHDVTLYMVAPLNQVKLYLAFSLDVDAARVARWQQALWQTYKDGSMRQLYFTHFPNPMIEQLEAAAVQ